MGFGDERADEGVRLSGLARKPNFASAAKGEKRVSVVEHTAGDLNGSVMALREEVAMLEDALRGFLSDIPEPVQPGFDEDGVDVGLPPLARALDGTKDIVEQARRVVRSLTQRL